MGTEYVPLKIRCKACGMKIMRDAIVCPFCKAKKASVVPTLPAKFLVVKKPAKPKLNAMDLLAFPSEQKVWVGKRSIFRRLRDLLGI